MYPRVPRSTTVRGGGAAAGLGVAAHLVPGPLKARAPAYEDDRWPLEYITACAPSRAPHPDRTPHETIATRARRSGTPSAQYRSISASPSAGPARLRMQPAIKKRAASREENETSDISTESPHGGRQHAQARLDLATCSVEDVLAGLKHVDDYLHLDAIADKLQSATQRVQDAANRRYAHSITAVPGHPTPEEIHTVRRGLAALLPGCNQPAGPQPPRLLTPAHPRSPPLAPAPPPCAAVPPLAAPHQGARARRGHGDAGGGGPRDPGHRRHLQAGRVLGQGAAAVLQVGGFRAVVWCVECGGVGGGVQ